MGWDFYNNANGAFMSYFFKYTESVPIPVWPYPVQLATFLIKQQTASVPDRLAASVFGGLAGRARCSCPRRA